jgi:alpha-1,2-mannosyltransferase
VAVSERVRRGAPVALCAGWAAVLAGVIAARNGAPLDSDVAVRDLVTAAGDGTGPRIAGALTQFGAGPVLYPVLIVLCALGLRARSTARVFLPVGAFAAGQVVEIVLFASLDRPAPGGLVSTTFSSGHCAAAVLGWGLVAWQVGRLRRPDGGPAPRWLWPFALAAGAAVGATRVYLGVHWVSDALAGVLVGAVLLASVLVLLGRATRHRDPAEPDAAGSSSGRAVAWLRTSPWAWGVPAVAAAIPIAGLFAETGPERLKDMLVYHGAGGSAGAGENLYAYRTVFSMPFTYPPFAALLVEPLSRMPLGVAQFLWTVATLAAVVGVAAVVLRPVAARIGLPLTVAALLVTAPVRSHLRFGQVGLFLVLLVASDLLRRRREGDHVLRPGLGLGLATAIKLTPAVFLPWLLVTGKWRRLFGTVFWGGVATVVGLLLLWPSSIDYVLHASRDTTRFGRNDIVGNQSVRGMLLRALADGPAEYAWLGCALVLVAVGTWQARRCERAGNRLAAVGVLAALSVAVSPISWVHHLVWLAFPIAALAAAGRWRVVSAWFVVLVVSFPALGRSLELPPLTELQGLSAVAAIFLLPALVGIRGRRPPADAATPPTPSDTTAPRATAVPAGPLP